MKKFIIIALTFTVFAYLYFEFVASSYSAPSDNTREKTSLFPESNSYVTGKIFYPHGGVVERAGVDSYKKLDGGGYDLRQGASSGTVSERDGSYKLELEPGQYDLCAWKQSENYLLPNVLIYGLSVGGKCETVIISEDDHKEINLTLAPQANSLRGKITDWEAMYRLSQATVVVYRPLKHIEDKGKVKLVLTSLEEADWDAKAEVKPNEKGEFVVNGLPEGDYFLRLEFPDRETWFYKTGSDKEPTPIHVKNKAKNEIEFSFYSMSGRTVEGAKNKKAVKALAKSPRQ